MSKAIISQLNVDSQAQTPTIKVKSPTDDTTKSHDNELLAILDSLRLLEKNGARFCRIHWGVKRPHGNAWHKTPYQLKQIDLNRAGCGLIFGHGGLLALDIDNAAGAERFLNYFGQRAIDYPSVSWYSGKDFSGNFNPEIGSEHNIQILFKLTEAQGAKLSGRKAFENNSLDLRWTGSQSVLPTKSPHPNTGQPYLWHHAPTDWAIALMPDDIWERMIADLTGSREGAAATEIKAGRDESPLVQWMQTRVFKKLGIDGWDLFDHGFTDERDKWRGVSHREGATNPTSLMINKETPWLAYDFGDSQSWTIYRYYNFFKFGDATPPKGDRFIKICQLLAAKAMLAIPANLIGGDRGHSAWQKFNTFTPDKILDAGDGYLSDVLPVPEHGEAIAIRAPMGTGKSHWIRECDRALLGQKVDYPTYRNSLGLQQHQNSDRAKSTTASHIGDVEFLRYQESGFIDRLHGWGCVHSSNHKKNGFLEGCNQFWDEFSGIINCLITDPNFRDFVEVWDKIIYGLKHCNRLIATDANATDAAVDFLAKVSGRDITKTLIKSNRQQLKKIARLTHTVCLEDWGGDQIKINEKDFSPMLADMLEYLNRGKIAVSSDSQLHCETVDRLLTALGFKCLRIDSTTSAKSEQKRFQNDPSWLDASDYDVLIFSPTLESGVNIWCPFEQHFDFDFGVCGVGATKQRLGRCRGAKDTTLWQNPLPLRPDEILTQPANVARFLAKKEAIIQSWQNDPELTQFRGEVFDKYRPFIDYACQYLAAKNWERWHPREALKELMEMDGVEVKDYFEESEPEQTQNYKKFKEEVKDYHAATTFDARDICKSEADTIASKNAATFEDQCAVKKFHIKQAFPGIENGKFWSIGTVKTLLFKSEIWNQAKVAHLISNEDIEKFKPLDAGQGRYARPWDWKSHILMAWLLKEAGLREFIQSGPFTNTDPRITELIGVVKANAPIFNLNLPQKDRIKALNRILKKIGMKAAATGRSQTEDGVERLYSIAPIHDADLFEDLKNRAGDRLQERLAKLQESHKTGDRGETAQNLSTVGDTSPIHFEPAYIYTGQSGSAEPLQKTQQPEQKYEHDGVTSTPDDAIASEPPELTPTAFTDEAIEADMWSWVWGALALDDWLESFGYVWEAVKSMGDRYASMVVDEFQEEVRAVDPGGLRFLAS